MEIVETKEHLECHCCTTKDDFYICELDNCDYPLCLTCKEKVLKFLVKDRSIPPIFISGPIL